MRAAFRDNSIKHIQILEEVKDCDFLFYGSVCVRESSVKCARRTRNILFTATHSMISTYFGSMTIVLKLPLTRAASTNGLHKYNGFWVPGAVPEGDTGGAPSFEVGNVEEVGVGERLGPLGPERCIVRLPQSRRVSRKKKAIWDTADVVSRTQSS